MKKTLRVVFGCGGTGGHIVPALAIAEIVKELSPTADILFIGGEGGMEERMVREAGYRLETIQVMGIRRSLSPSNFKALYLTVRAMSSARRLLAEFVPDIVIGTGGYVCYPALRAAISLGIPTAVHESNALPGLAVRRLAGGVDRIWLNFEGARGCLPQGKCLTVGNPLRRDFSVARPTTLPQGCRQMVLSFGGSLGARELNRAALDLMEEVAKHPEICYVHATGRSSYEEWYRAFVARGLERYKNLCPLPFITDMSVRLATADVVIARAGAMTLSELAAAGRCAVLVPSPNVTGDHQRKNASLLASAGAATVLEEADLAGRLPECVLALLAAPERRAKFETNIKKFFHKDSNKKIARDIEALIAMRH